jgi:hypothetical protein
MTIRKGMKRQAQFENYALDFAPPRLGGAM